VKNAIEKGKGKIIVEGEEDLAALPALMLAPEGALVLYGQPGEGIVAVRAGRESASRAREIYSRMADG
jgi:uncharacterized protein (UPF0218 family)